MEAAYLMESTKALLIRQKLRHLSSPRMMHPHGTIHKLDPIGFTSLNNDIKLSNIESHRLLKKKMLLLLSNENSPVDMQASRKWNIDSINVWIIEKGFIGAVNLSVGREGIGGGKGGGLFQRAAGHGVESGVGSESDGSRELAGNVGAAQNAKSDAGVGHCTLGRNRKESRE